MSQSCETPLPQICPNCGRLWPSDVEFIKTDLKTNNSWFRCCSFPVEYTKPVDCDHIARTFHGYERVVSAKIAVAHFDLLLAAAFSRADPQNLARLAQAFPAIHTLFKLWRHDPSVFYRRFIKEDSPEDEDEDDDEDEDAKQMVDESSGDESSSDCEPVNDYNDDVY